MNIGELSSGLKLAAADWSTHPFDPVELGRVAEARNRDDNRRALAGALVVLLLAGVTAGAIWSTRHSNDHHQAVPAPAPASNAISNAGAGVAPLAPASVVIAPIGGTGHSIAHQLVLARTLGGTSVTVHARLFFRRNAPARVRDSGIVIALPGTSPGASPDTTGDYYRSSRVAISPLVNATSPRTRILTVSTPSGLAPGRYPVLTVIRTAPLPGQHPGRGGSFEESSELGIIVITPR